MQDLLWPFLDFICQWGLKCSDHFMSQKHAFPNEHCQKHQNHPNASRIRCNPALAGLLPRHPDMLISSISARYYLTSLQGWWRGLPLATCSNLRIVAWLGVGKVILSNPGHAIGKPCAFSPILSGHKMRALRASSMSRNAQTEYHFYY